MKLLSSRVLKSPYVHLDSENALEIEIMASTLALAEEDEDEVFTEPGLSPEVKADNILQEAELKAKAMRRKAEAEAAELLREAQADAEQQATGIKEEARRTGYDEGYNKGVAEAEVLKQNAQQVLDDAKAEREKIIQSIEGDMVELMQKLLQKLLTNSAYINPNIILYLIRQGLSGATLSGDITIHVSPVDYPVVLQGKDDILTHTQGVMAVDIVKDLSLGQSDCIIETAFGTIDCGLDQQFKALQEDLYHICSLGDSQ